MSSLKEVKNRISSVKSTRQITSAMKMVASAKLHKAQGRIENMLPYQRKLSEILTNFLRTDASFESPYTEKRPVTRVAVVAFSSNSSLCGITPPQRVCAGSMKSTTESSRCFPLPALVRKKTL